MKLYSTNTPNLFYGINKNDEKVYYARFRKNGIEYRRKLSTSLRSAKSKLQAFLKADSLDPIVKPKNTLESILPNEGNTKYALNNVFKEYIDMVAPNQSEQEIRTKLSRYKLHIEPLIGHRSIRTLKYKDCQNVINVALKVKELSPKTAKNIKALIQAILTYCVKNEYIDKNVASFVEIPPFDNKVAMLLELDEIKLLIDNILLIDNQIYRLIFLFALHGRRRREILTMQWYQIDFLNQEYNIPPQKNKSKKSDTHKMTELLYKELKAFYDSQFHGDVNINQYLFINPQTNKPYRDLRRYFATLKEKSNINKPFRFHDFRHLLATVLINQCKLPIEHVSHTLGHSSIEITQRYITKDSKVSKDSVNDFLNFIGIQNIS